MIYSTTYKHVKQAVHTWMIRPVMHNVADPSTAAIGQWVKAVTDDKGERIAEAIIVKHLTEDEVKAMNPDFGTSTWDDMKAAMDRNIEAFMVRGINVAMQWCVLEYLDLDVRMVVPKCPHVN